MYVAIAFALFWLFCLKVFVPGPVNDLENTGISEPADYNWSLMDLDGQAVSFAKFKGKTVFLNIWATWCGPCVGEMPSIAKLARDPRLHNKNIEFLCVSTDDVGLCRTPLPGRQGLDHDNSSRERCPRCSRPRASRPHF